MKRHRGRRGTLTPEQVKAIHAAIIEAAMEGTANAARLSETAWELTRRLKEDTPDLAERLKLIDALVKASNGAVSLALNLVSAGVIPCPDLAPAPGSPGMAPVALVFLLPPPLPLPLVG